MPDKNTDVHCIFILVLRKTKLPGSEVLQAQRIVQKITMCSTENRYYYVLLLKIFNIGIYSANLKKIRQLNTKSLLCFLKEFFFFPGGGRGKGLWDKFI